MDFSTKSVIDIKNIFSRHADFFGKTRDSACRDDVSHVSRKHVCEEKNRCDRSLIVWVCEFSPTIEGKSTFFENFPKTWSCLVWIFLG